MKAHGHSSTQLKDENSQACYEKAMGTKAEDPVQPDKEAFWSYNKGLFCSMGEFNCEILSIGES